MNNSKGGFVGSNSGKINDCYSLLGLDGKKAGISGFFGSNTGSIRQSFHSGRLGCMDNGFGTGGDLKNCLYFTGHGEAEKAEQLPDHNLWKEDTNVNSVEDASRLGFDQKIWNYTGDKQVLEFREENWYCKPDELKSLPTEGPLAGTSREQIIISNAEELQSFASRVNSGDAAARTAEVTLTSDINFSGKDWKPIGIDKAHSFRGSFDGKGHRISNFRIKDKVLEYKGFFGVLEGGVYNLTVDCSIIGSGTIGALTAQLIGGTIRCCGAVTNLQPRGEVEAVGGLVGTSTGTISLSYSAGKLRFVPLFPWPLLLIPAAAIVAIAIIVSQPGQPLNNPVETEEEQLPIPPADLPDLPESESGAMHSISFSTSTEATADLSTGKVALTYQSTNPDADQKVIVQLRLSNGVVIAETGAIMPGNMITEMTLTDRAMAELTPGRYTASIYMIPYSVEDETKGFTETEVPITLTVE
ncbi:MAG: hypothetical protein IKF90_25955 [Parasporobacterium sp.]|nr:hypothetical protein [Parasporobacterium sp.]